MVLLVMALLVAALLQLRVTGAGTTARRPLPPPTPPNIFFVVVDDLGFDDTSLHGSAQIPTPQLRLLAQRGALLMQHYSMPVCTPTRSAILTGVHPIHSGMQCGALLGQQKLGLPLRFKLLPQMLTESLNYEAMAVGKWHLGFMTEDYLATSRGFSRFYGFLTGKEDYFTHTDMEYNCAGHSSLRAAPFVCANVTSNRGPGAYFGLDLYANTTVDRTQSGRYNTHLFTAKAISMLETRDTNRSTYLYLAYNAVHNANPADPLQVPAHYIEPFVRGIPCNGRSGNELVACLDRRKFAGMLSAVDQGIFNLSKASERLEMAPSTLWVVISDNGGPSDDQCGDSWSRHVDRNVASNAPLRGKKATVWEGGTRTLALVSGYGVGFPGSIRVGLMHVADWVPTLLEAAGSPPNGGASQGLSSVGGPPPYVDSVSAWPMLSRNSSSARREVLLNIHEVVGSASLRVGDWKVLLGSKEQECGGHYDGVAGLVRGEPAVAGGAVDCGDATPIPCDPSVAPCLFCVGYGCKLPDPCERRDLSKSEPQRLAELLSRLSEINATAVPCLNNPKRFKEAWWWPAANPSLHDGAWVPWVNDSRWESLEPIYPS